MSLHNDNALVVALDTSTDMLACAASWIDVQTGEAKLASGDICVAAMPTWSS